ncbi:L-asparaginase [Bradyrhizobium sp. GM7.3]
MKKARIAFISTGGTLAFIESDRLKAIDYSKRGIMLKAREILNEIPEAGDIVDIDVYDEGPLMSSAISFPILRRMALCERICRQQPGTSGIVIGHGTSTLEETAYFLNLCLKVDVPVVIVGSQRALSALSSDAGMNLIGALRVAACPQARGQGVLVVLNDEIHTARDVTKGATLRLNAFRSYEFGPIGRIDGDNVLFYRKSLRKNYPETEFDVSDLEELPRVEIAYSHVDADGTAVRAFVAAGAAGIVIAGLGPGGPVQLEIPAYAYASSRGVILVQATRCGTGRAYSQSSIATRECTFIDADNLTPKGQNTSRARSHAHF